MNKNNIKTMSFINKADGPTSIFFIGKDNKDITLRQKIQRMRNTVRRKKIIKYLKANAHTMDQVALYIVNELGFTEVDKSDSQYQTEYHQMRTSFILQYKPELLGELAHAPQLENYDEESVKTFFEQLEARQNAAEKIPANIFDIDLHIYTKEYNKLEIKISIEKQYEYIGGSASGSKKSDIKKYNATFRKIYLYYGVTQKDIDEYTKRYEDVVRTLALR